MKRFLKLISSLFLLLLVASVIFFFWASSPTMAKSEYSKLIKNDYESVVSNDSVYSIITYNIGYLSGMSNNKAVKMPKELFDNNLKQATSLFKLRKPDIIAFQEIDYNSARSYHVNQQTEIAKLGYNYVAQGTNWDETYLPFPYWPPSVHYGKMHSGQSILSKYEIKDYERLVLDRVEDSPFHRDAFYLERLVQVCKVNLDGKDVVVINVHLEAFDKPTRVKQFNVVLEIFNQYKDKYPTILLGDFNSKARDKEAAIQQMFALKGIGNAAFNYKNPANTFDTNYPYKRIDYIFYTEETIEYIKGRVLTEFGKVSDHLPVEMKFKLK